MKSRLGLAARVVVTIVIPAIALAWAVLACGDKNPSAQVGEPPVSPVEPSGPAPGDAGTRTETPRPRYTAEQKQRYRLHVAQGRRLAQARRWGEAARAFEQALAIIPMDGWALSELGWAAFQAGDYDLARTANRDAVRASTDRNARAASLYNLGRVAEAIGNRSLAAQHYQASLEIRPNRTVQRRLAGLGQDVPKPGTVDYSPCGPTSDLDALCRCVVAHYSLDPGRPRSCHREARQSAGVELLFAGDEVEEWVHLIALGPGGWSSRALLGYVYNPEAFGIHEELEIARWQRRTIGDRTALWIETVQTRTDRDDVRDVIESSEVRQLTLCSWPGDNALLSCTLQLPLYERYQRQPASGAGTSTIRRLEVVIRDNGTAKIVLVEGDKSAAVAPLVGEHTLW